MSMLTSHSDEKQRRREDFPVDSFRYLEARLQELRKRVMDRAAEIADAAEDADASVYRVERVHIETALDEFLRDPTADPI